MASSDPSPEASARSSGEAESLGRGLCESCRYWAQPHTIRNQHLMIKGFGECRRRAPSGMSVSFAADSDVRVLGVSYPFPPSPPDDWCGDYEYGPSCRPNPALATSPTAPQPHDQQSAGDKSREDQKP